MDKSQPQEAGLWRRKLSQTVMDLARDLRDCSFLIWAFLEDCDCSSWKALSFLAAAVADFFGGGAREGRRRKAEVEEEEVRGVCLAAAKNWVLGDWAVGLKEERLGVLKLDMSLRSEEEERRGKGEGQGCSSPSIVGNWKSGARKKE